MAVFSVRRGCFVAAFGGMLHRLLGKPVLCLLFKILLSVDYKMEDGGRDISLSRESAISPTTSGFGLVLVPPHHNRKARLADNQQPPSNPSIASFSIQKPTSLRTFQFFI